MSCPLNRLATSSATTLSAALFVLAVSIGLSAALATTYVVIDVYAVYGV